MIIQFIEVILNTFIFQRLFYVEQRFTSRKLPRKIIIKIVLHCSSQSLNHHKNVTIMK